MKKINILLLTLLMAPIFTFLLFSKNTPTNGSVIYLHEHQNKDKTSLELLASFINNGNVIITFYADWCGPCKRMAPVIDTVATSMPGFTFIKVNRDRFLDLARNFNITSIPTLIFIHNGKTIGRYDGGPLTEKTLAQLITRTYITV